MTTITVIAGSRAVPRPRKGAVRISSYPQLQERSYLANIFIASAPNCSRGLGAQLFARGEDRVGGTGAFLLHGGRRQQGVRGGPAEGLRGLSRQIARREGARITHVFETHRNEDYAIGSMEMAERTGAKVFHGPGLDFDYGETLNDGQTFSFGDLELRAIHTPGHTDESMSYVLLIDKGTGDEAVAVFTGDALFVGDVGRTDLPGPDKQERLSHAPLPQLAWQAHDLRGWGHRLPWPWGRLGLRRGHQREGLLHGRTGEAAEPFASFDGGGVRQKTGWSRSWTDRPTSVVWKR